MDTHTGMIRYQLNTCCIRMFCVVLPNSTWHNEHICDQAGVHEADMGNTLQAVHNTAEHEQSAASLCSCYALLL
jgi:hypothetical protein